MTWSDACVATPGTHHELAGMPMYPHRFNAVQKFHEPGLAPVADETGAYHIDPRGEAAYEARFHQSWGFYDGLAAVEDESGWYHIRPDGEPLTGRRDAWCGNFQEGRCPVRRFDGLYCHLVESGSPLQEAGLLYCGDFRDGVAVVRCPENARCRHIRKGGAFAHPASFLDLDIYHKGYARARDERGWHHVNLDGLPAYAARFACIEPFYNGAALCEQFDGGRVVIDEQGHVVVAVV